METIYREVRRITADNLRRLCISKGWYTKGNNSDYENLLYHLAEDKDNITTEDIIEISKDIVEHSSRLSKYDLKSVAYEILRTAFTVIVEEE